MAPRNQPAACAAVLLAAASFALASVSPSLAGGRWGPRPEPDYVMAESRFGNGTVSGPVRPTRTGYEVRKPNGTWIACRRSCAETLRVATVDFFENEGSMSGYGTAMNECGIFGCLDLGFRR